MKQALALAKKGWGRTNPNPLVGAVIVKEDEIIGQGYHHQLGDAHAEIEALNAAKKDVKGATLYVNLEPCSHFGRTPPCVQTIIQTGIKEVVIGMEDPNPMVSGNGIRILKEAGITVITNVLENEAKALNDIFIKYITHKEPYVILKAAMTLDGKIAAHTGDSKWVTGAKARAHVHQIRERVSAIMVGINTVLLDNPSLTTRTINKLDCTRIIVDSQGRIPLGSQVINSDSKAKTILATTTRIPTEKESLLKEKGLILIKCDGKDGRVDLQLLMKELYKLEIDSILLEGGGTLNWSAIESGIVDKVMFYIAPKLIGGANAITPIEGNGFPIMNKALSLKNLTMKKLGEDFLMEGTF